MIHSKQTRCLKGIKPQKATCPMCKKNNTQKRKRAPFFYCFVCKVAFRDPLIIEPNDTEVV